MPPGGDRRRSERVGGVWISCSCFGACSYSRFDVSESKRKGSRCGGAGARARARATGSRGLASCGFEMKKGISSHASSQSIERAFAAALERYAELGVDVESALNRFARISISLHCWQGD